MRVAGVMYRIEYQKDRTQLQVVDGHPRMLGTVKQGLGVSEALDGVRLIHCFHPSSKQHVSVVNSSISLSLLFGTVPNSLSLSLSLSLSSQQQEL
jgi:hypothetical protein